MRALQIAIIALLMATASVSALTERPDLTTIDLEYGSKTPLQLYANSKYSIRVLGFPSDAHYAQVMPRLRTDYLEMHLLGDHSHNVGTDRAASIEFGLQLPAPHLKSNSACSVDPNESNVCSDQDYISFGELRIKSFTKTSDSSYQHLEDFIIPVHTKFCLEHKPVCGMLSGDRVTYSDSCELHKAGAELLYDGKCQY